MGAEKYMRLFKKKNETEKRQFIKDCIKEGHIKPENEEEAVQELLKLDVIVRR